MTNIHVTNSHIEAKMKYSCTKMGRPVLIALFLLLMQISGCSFGRYSTGDISKNPSLVNLDANSVRNELVLDKTTGIARSRNTRVEFGSDKTFSVKYHRSVVYEAPNVNISVALPNGSKYVAYLDTGAPGYVIVGSDVVLDNKFPIWPAFYSDGHTSMGICRIPELTVGAVKIKDIMAPYEEQQWQARILNIPIYKLSAMILGRDFIKSFDYVMFDNVHKEAVFSKAGAFVPDDPELWSSYPFLEDPNAGNTIKARVPIEGRVFDLAFDSCGDKPGLNLSKSDWQAIKQDVSYELLGKADGMTWQGMKLLGQKARVSKLSVGERTLRDIEVSISDGLGGFSIISLDYFQDTAVVLDYVNHLFWIKKTGTNPE